MTTTIRWTAARVHSSGAKRLVQMRGDDRGEGVISVAIAALCKDAISR